MNSFGHSSKHAKAFIQAFQRPTVARRFKAPPAVVDSGQFAPRHRQLFSSSLNHRWITATSLIPRPVNQVPGLDVHPSASCSFSSTGTPQVDGKDSTTAAPLPEDTATPTAEAVEPADTAHFTEGSQPISQEEENKEDLVGVPGEKLALLEEKNKEVEELKEKLLWSLAEMEHVRSRTKRDAESTRKFAIQEFAKGLLDVADNLYRATGAVPANIAKANPADDISGNIKVLQSLLKGVEMTEKQLLQVFKKHGLEKYQSVGQPFDPNRHSAVFEVQDAIKPPGTIAMELKAGYILNDRVIRPAEVAVVKEE